MHRISQLVLAVALFSVASLPPAHAGWYVAVGAGDASLDSDTLPPSRVQDSDSDDELPWKLVIGNAGERVSLEVFTAQFGELELDPVGTLERRVHGLVVRKRLYSSHCASHPKQLDLSASVGYGRISSDYTNVEEQPRSSGNLIGGVSAGFRFGAGIGLRADYDYFDEDTKLATLSLVKQFGGSVACKAAKAPDIVATAAVSATAQPASTAGQLADIQFNRDSTFLTDRARAQLVNIARLMSAYPRMVLEVQGHSDSSEWGGSDFGLSAERSRRVANTLSELGIARERMQLSGYADSRPVANRVASELNRRVQFRILSVR